MLVSPAMLCMAIGRATPSPGSSPLPLAKARTLDLDISRGSWMSLDLSPDGRTILFDMLGDLYLLPVTGGEARQLTRGLAFDTQPVFSPDGGSIAFVSDRSGSDNLWVMRADGSDAHAVTDYEGDGTFSSPAWSADGKALYASFYRADLNNYALSRYGLDGGVTELAPVKPAPDADRSAWRSSLGAFPSRDGRYLYFERRVGGLDYDEVDAWTIVRRDLSDGSEQPVVRGSGGRGAQRETFFRPVVSPDGRLLAYAARAGDDTELRIRDLATGVDRRLAALDPDQIESSMWQDIVPRYTFTPDGGALILAKAGQFERVPVDGGPIRPIALHARARVDVAASNRIALHEDRGPVRARLVQAPVASPDGSRIAFSALGRLYVSDADGAHPRLIETGTTAFQPDWSADSRHIVYVSWSEGAGGAVWTVAADGSAAPKRIDDLPAYYTDPVFAPDGGIVVIRSAAAARQQTNFEYGSIRDAELVRLPVDGGSAKRLFAGRIGGHPHWSAGHPGILVLTGEGLKTIDPATGKAAMVAQVKGPGYYFVEGDTPVEDLRASPDGKWLLAQNAGQLYLLPIPPSGATVDLTDPAANAVALTGVGADFFGWRADGSIDWSLGSHWVHRPAAGTGLAEADLTVEVPRAIAPGRLLLRGARILTMADGDRIIPSGDVLIEDGRITAVGATGTLKVPAGTQERDVSGKTILPGFIDNHDHIAEVRRGVLSLENWGLRARLAYGVTTSFDPSTLSIDALAYQDLLDSGAMLGPRLRSTGVALFSFHRLRSLDQTRAVLSRYSRFYRLGNLKEYRTGNRRVRQWVSQAAREQGLVATTEGALSFKLDLTQIIDGFAGNEHSLPAAPLGDDVVQLMKAMRASYTLTLSITHGGPPAADWFAARDDAAHDPKVRRFWPPSAIAQKLAHRDWRPLEAYHLPGIVSGAAALAKAGGLVGMGAHGEAPGIGFHWEMEAHVLGGMTPMQVLHAATAGSAETIGRLADLGTIAPGKIADLVILDADPLADIRNSRAIDAVMRDGFLYDAGSLARLWPVAGAAPRPWFAAPDARHWLPVAP